LPRQRMSIYPGGWRRKQRKKERVVRIRTFKTVEPCLQGTYSHSIVAGGLLLTS